MRSCRSLTSPIRITLLPLAIELSITQLIAAAAEGHGRARLPIRFYLLTELTRKSRSCVPGNSSRLCDALNLVIPMVEMRWKWKEKTIHYSNTGMTARLGEPSQSTT